MQVRERQSPTARRGVDDYPLGHSVAEQRRLTEQAVILRPATERFLRDAGVRRGMRVLDVGCGVGDVTCLAAEIVGAEGSVVGVDSAGAVLASWIARLLETFERSGAHTDMGLRLHQAFMDAGLPAPEDLN